MYARKHHGQGLILTLTGLLLLASFGLQYFEALLPCPLCIMQRLMMFLIFLVAWAGFLTGRRFLWGLEVLFALAGAFFAIRQLWLQANPVLDTGVCLPGVQQLIHHLPWHEVLQAFVWGGQSSCGEVGWQLLGLSMPAWSLIYFSLIGILSVWFGVKVFRDEHV